MEEDGVSSKSDNLRRHIKRGRKRELRVRTGWTESAILMGEVGLEGAEGSKGYPHNTERNEMTVDGVVGRRITLSSAASEHSSPYCLCCFHCVSFPAPSFLL